MIRFATTIFTAFSAAVLLTACSAGGDNQGVEYAPNMYHSVAYEPYTQIVDQGCRKLADIVNLNIRMVTLNSLTRTSSIRII